MDIGASGQAVTEEIMLRMTQSLAAHTGIKNLCLVGGVALNCVANGKILRDAAFENIWVQPAADDAGGSVGLALVTYHLHLDHPRHVNGTLNGMQGSYLGPSYAHSDIESALTAAGAKYETLGDDALIQTTADALADELAIGWFQGRMEFGPRAMGNRLIISDPRSLSLQKTLNLRVKYRESFRPFAPSVLCEDVSEWFETNDDSPYMLMVAGVKKEHHRALAHEENSLFGIEKLNVVRSDIPAVTHVDYSAHIQTVRAETNPRYHALISAFNARSGCPMVVNTSFNVRGEPIVNTPDDAFRCFIGTDMEVLVVGNGFLRKEDQDPSLKLDYKDAFELD
jgi:carbamoyltransferase